VNEVTTLKPLGREPALCSYQLQAALARASNTYEDGTIAHDALPAGARLALETRGRELGDLLLPADESRIRLILTTLVDMGGRLNVDPKAQKFAVARDVSDLSGLPEFALAASARAFRRGEVGSATFAPTTAQIRKLAVEKARPWREEHERIKLVLNAKVLDAPPSPEKRAEMIERFRALAKAPFAPMPDLGEK
jgi:hypothetical protein